MFQVEGVNMTDNQEEAGVKQELVETQESVVHQCPGLAPHVTCPLQPIVDQLQVQVASFSSQVAILHERLEKLEQEKKDRVAAALQRKRGRPSKRSMSVGNDPSSSSNSSRARYSPQQSPASAPILPRMENGFYSGSGQRGNFYKDSSAQESDKKSRDRRSSHKTSKDSRSRKKVKHGERSHRQRHTGDDHHRKKLKVISKTFRSTGKTFTCNICNKEFPSSSAIVKHERSDHQEFRWSCRYCQKTFRHSESCARHEATFHSENSPRYDGDDQKGYPCNSCSEIFATLPELNEHRSGAHSERILASYTNSPRDAFSCGVCGLVAATSSGLVRHIKGSHPNYNPAGSQSSNLSEQSLE